MIWITINLLPGDRTDASVSRDVLAYFEVKLSEVWPYFCHLIRRYISSSVQNNVGEDKALNYCIKKHDRKESGKLLVKDSYSGDKCGADPSWHSVWPFPL